MAPRVFWKGYLKLSLVTCRVALVPAISENERVRFHNINRKTKNRVLNQYVDSVSGKPVDEDDQVKGYERGENDYVLFEDEEIADVGLESTRTIDIETFVPANSIGWIWYDRPHFLTPDDAVSEEAFGVIRDAMDKTGKGGIARLVMYRRERAVLLLPKDKGMVLWTLRYGDEVRDADPYFKLAVTSEKPEAKAATMMKSLIGKYTKPWDPEMADDPVQDKLHEIIAAKKKGRKTAKVKKPEQPAESNVINIMDALRNSLAAERKPKKG